MGILDAFGPIATRLRALKETVAGYVDTLAAGVGLQDDSTSLATDVHAILSQLRRALYGDTPGAGERWYDPPGPLGLVGLNADASARQCGEVLAAAFSGTPSATAVVTLPAPYATNEYQITLALETTSQRSFIATYESVLADRFTIDLNSARTFGLIKISWQTCYMGA